jgi:hypothetical protein
LSKNINHFFNSGRLSLFVVEDYRLKKILSFPRFMQSINQVFLSYQPPSLPCR